MTDGTHDIAPLGPVGLHTDRFAEGLDLFTRVFGLELSMRDDRAASLRPTDGCELPSLNLTRQTSPGSGMPPTLRKAPRRVKAIEASGDKVHGRAAGDMGPGPAFRVEVPFGNVFGICRETRRDTPEGADRPARTNTTAAFTGAAPRRPDHLDLLAEDATEVRRAVETCPGARVTEMIRLDTGRLGGGRFAVNSKTYDRACTEQLGGGHGRLHRVASAADQCGDIRRAADIFLPNGEHIETGPHKHAIQGTFFLYVREPAGNRRALANAGARLILAPNREPVVWTEAEGQKGQARGLKTIETFHTHGTPPVPGKH